MAIVWYVVCSVKNAPITSVWSCRPRARTNSRRSCCWALAWETSSGCWKLPHSGMRTVSLAWNGSGVKWNGYAALRSRIACSAAGLKEYCVQSSGGCPEPPLSHALLAYAHVVESAAAPARALAMVGLMSDSFWVKPDQPADSDRDGP